jgi:plasmid stabilization system protein ParE
MKVRWTYRARDDLLEIGRFIAADNPQAARAWVARLRRRARQAAAFPRAGRIVPEVQREEVREVLEGRYRIVYRIHGRAVEVLTVFEGHWLLPRHLLREELPS